MPSYYDTLQFRRDWLSSKTLAEIAQDIGCSIPSVSQAAKRRGLPNRYEARRQLEAKEMNNRETEFFNAFNAAVEAANRRPEGADHLALCNALALEYGIAPRRASEIIVDNITSVARTG